MSLTCSKEKEKSKYITFYYSYQSCLITVIIVITAITVITVITVISHAFVRYSEVPKNHKICPNIGEIF